MVDLALDPLFVSSSHHNSYVFNVKRYDYNHVEYARINNYLAPIMWTLHKAIATFVPVRHFKTSSVPKWYSRLKKAAHRIFKMSHKEEN